MRILVTGCNGFIGKNIIGWLQQEADWYVEGYDWHPVERPDVSSFDWVIHLGAIADMSTTDVDAIMAQNYDFSCWLFDECNYHGTNLQYASSSSVYGDTKDFSEHAPCNPQTAYAWSKYLFDRYWPKQDVKIYVHGFRYFNVYGRYNHLRGSRCNVIEKWRTQARKEGKISVWENAEHIKRDWTFVGDVCRLHIDFIKTVKGSGIWNCGAGIAHSFLDIAEEIAEIENVPIELVPVPEAEKQRMRHTTKADLTLLKATIGKRKWLNVYEWLRET